MDYRFGLIGFPIKHSLSPWIHNQFLERTKINGHYDIIEIDVQLSFHEELKKLKESGIDGFNITVPYKQKIIPFLDDIDETARNIGAVNTVVVKQGKWIGYNTDGLGYVRALKSKYPTLFKHHNTPILIIGAGGAARGIYYALAKSGMTKIDIANRTTEHALEIAQLKASATDTNVYTLKDVAMKLNQYDAIIQTTSVGMKPNEHQSVLTLNGLKRGTIVSDIVYQPIMTKFLKEAKTRGALIHHGHTMLLYQAQLAFEIWTGKIVDVDDLEVKLKEILEG